MLSMWDESLSHMASEKGVTMLVAAIVEVLASYANAS